MEKKNIFTIFAKYVSLNVIAMLGLSCYILADTYFVANALGPNGLTALNLAIPVFSFINGTGLMLGMGGGTKYAICKAQRRARDGDEVFSQSLSFGLISGFFFLVIGLIFSGDLSQILGSDADTFEMTRIYLKTLLCFAPMFIVNNLLVVFVRNDGNPNLSMTAMLLGSISNIFLDYLFLYVFHMGMFGAAFATGFSPIISMAVLSVYFLRRKNGFHLVRVRAGLQSFRKISAPGLSSLIGELSSGLVIILFNLEILHLAGNLGVAAYGIVTNIALVATALFTGVAQGTQPLISTYYGKKNPKGLIHTFYYAIGTAFLLAFLVYGSCFLFAPQIVRAFNSSQDPILSRLAIQGLHLYFTGFFFSGCNIITAAYFSAIELPLPSLAISLIRGCIAIIPFLFLFGAAFGMKGVWLSYPAAELAAFALSVCLTLTQHKKRALRL